MSLQREPTETMTGRVSRVSRWGFQINDEGDTWYNLTKYNPPTLPNKGDNIRFEVGIEKGYVHEITVLSAGTVSERIAAPPPAERQESLPPEAYEDSGEMPLPFDTYEPTAKKTTKDSVITRLACLKAAATACQGLGADAEDMIKLAAAFETWVNRT